MNTFITFRVILVSTSFALLLGPVGYLITRKLNLTDDPRSAPHKQHNTPTSVAGGPVLFVSILASGVIFGFYKTSIFLPILLGSSIIFLFGIWDDLKNISPLWKLIGQLLAAIILIYFGVQVRLFRQDWLNYLLTILWVVGIINAYNFVDSMDGLAVGLAVIASSFFILVTIDSGQPELTLLSTILVGVCLGAFFYNATPAVFFLGDSGAQLLGFILAALGIAYNPVGFERIASWYVPILLIGVPIFDTTLVVFSRLRRRRRIYEAGLDHTYHRLVGLRLSSNRAVLAMHLAAILLGCLAFIALPLPPLISNLIFGAVLLAGMVGILILERKHEF